MFLSGLQNRICYVVSVKSSRCVLCFACVKRNSLQNSCLGDESCAMSDERWTQKARTTRYRRTLPGRPSLLKTVKISCRLRYLVRTVTYKYGTQGFRVLYLLYLEDLENQSRQKKISQGSRTLPRKNVFGIDEMHQASVSTFSRRDASLHMRTASLSTTKSQKICETSKKSKNPHHARQTRADIVWENTYHNQTKSTTTVLTSWLTSSLQLKVRNTSKSYSCSWRISMYHSIYPYPSNSGHGGVS